MPVFTAAVAAITAAVVGTGAIAAAVAATALAVGVVGAGLSVVGAITGNKTLSTIGKYMGYAGAIGGLAGGVIGGIDAAVESAGMGAGANLADMGSSFVDGFNQVYADASAGLSQAWESSPVNFWNSPAGTIQPTAMDAAAQTGGGSLPDVTATADIAANDAIGPRPSLEAESQAAAAPTGDTVTSVPTTGPPIQPNIAPVGTPATPTVMSNPPVAGMNVPGLTNTQGILGAGTSPLSSITQNQSAFGKWFESLEGYQKSAVLTGGLAGLQALGGAAQGMFVGATAQERLDFDRMVNEQRQQQLTLQNVRGTASPGIITFQNRPVQPAGQL